MIRVLVADDHRDVREALRELAGATEDVAVVGEAADAPSALRLTQSLHPDVLVLDPTMDDDAGFGVASRISAELEDTAIVALAADPARRERAIAAGGTAFVTKDAPPERIIGTLRATSDAIRSRPAVLSRLHRPWQRALDTLVASGASSWAQVQAALELRADGESVARALLRGSAARAEDLADAIAAAGATGRISLAPYPLAGRAIHPTERRLAAATRVDPVARDAARALPRDFCLANDVVLVERHGREGTLAMLDVFDEDALLEAERRSGLALTPITALGEDIRAAIARAYEDAADEPAPVRRRATGVFASTALAALALAVLGVVFAHDIAVGRVLAVSALVCGFLMFAYASKYYVTVAAVVGVALFGRSVPRRDDAGPRTDRDAAYRTLLGERLDRSGVIDRGPRDRANGAPRLPAERQPFVSVQVALYNERRVVDRLLGACTSFDYERYEVIVADDSTDETVEALAHWSDHPRVRVIHRATRSGFKGGALQNALKRMDPRTEYVLVFDADFVPPADAIWHFLEYFGALAENGEGTARDERIAVVQGYQWHMLNAGENWITKGVRTEFSGSYVVERAGQELFSAMKMISGSVYMIRADVLRSLGWSTSITEDWELTIRLYLAGYKVLYTPYIQAPAECVARLRQLIKQRMRWAEGHSYNVRKYLVPVMSSEHLTVKEKLEFVYYAAYYVQSVVFCLGTLAWLVAIFVLDQRLAAWNEYLGWSLVVANALALPLMNLTGILLEGSLRRDLPGLLSFLALTYVLAPFQAYAALKGLLERDEGGWHRTAKSGRVTEPVRAFRLARVLPWELPRRRLRPRRPRRTAVAAAAILLAAGIVGVGILSTRAAAATGAAEGGSGLVFGVASLLGLGLVAAVWLALRGRLGGAGIAVLAALLASAGLLAFAAPARGAAGNGNTFYFRASGAFGCTDADMTQSPPTGAGATLAGSDGKTYTFCSDTFTSSQSLSGGPVLVTTWLTNVSTVGLCDVTATLFHDNGIDGSHTQLGASLVHVLPNLLSPGEFQGSFSIQGFTFANGDRLRLQLAWSGLGCLLTSLSYDSPTYPSRVETAVIVPDGLGALLLAAPLLPLAARRVRRRWRG